MPGIDALFVGPGDLPPRWAISARSAIRDVQAKVEARRRGGARLASRSASSGPNPAMVRRFLDYGYDFAAIASDIAMMTGRAAEWMATLSRHVAP